VKKIRLDQVLVDRNLCESRERAQRLIRAGQVIVDQHCIDKPGICIDPSLEIRLRGSDCPYVSRGGLKLEAALRRFSLTRLAGRVALDIGASTGGFTDCLLQHGAGQVWAIDTGKNQLHPSLRANPNVHLKEKANARHLEPDWVHHQHIDFCVIDVSFISLRLILPAARKVLTPDADLIALIKPQFEAGPRDVGKGGIVRDPGVHRSVLDSLITWLQRENWRVMDLIPSPIRGAMGNIEFLIYLKYFETDASPGIPSDFSVESVLKEAYNESGVEKTTSG
jgi:23S rRNA (cytidine1920-2'-O)/16S rRNA (cytidine1409-2'-O)-methyltransferase